MAKTNAQRNGKRILVCGGGGRVVMGEWVSDEKSCWLRGRQVVRSQQGRPFPLFKPANQIVRTEWQLSDAGQREVTSLTSDLFSFFLGGSLFFFQL